MPTARGRIELISGCMFSGKTSALFDRLARAETLDQSTGLFKHVTDTRDGLGWLATHNGLRRRATPVNGAAAIARRAIGTALVAIDEGHFFDAALPAMCRQLADDGTRVIVTALDRDCWGYLVAVTTRLRELADRVTSLLGVCARCGGVATHTQRLTPIVGGDLVGGCETYEPRCARCFRPPPQTPSLDSSSHVALGAGRAG